MTGTIKFYKPHAGFGFIRTDDGDIFFHLSNVVGRTHLYAGDMVEFQIEHDERDRSRAVSVRRIDRAKDEAERIFKTKAA